ncbi:MAG: bifunctional methylenetetrahydrofolate dehydrogenase/methenyltetrahydrofolate cyclohydrolase FolD [Proteobacteria bacterium]|nr:bifunctional methylenetetrahydrofolate dehydrogenase/methenyltetrahydrofolate cyclohydrolase FolD [Pseudomonadota bacterium]
MTMELMNGKALARRLNIALKQRVAGLERPPGLGVVLVGADPASQIYVRLKGKVAGRLGLHHRQVDLPLDTSMETLLEVIDKLNDDPAIDGILVQLPLPDHLDAKVITDRIDPQKDVDGFTSVNTGLLALGRPLLVPCTPLGIMRMLADAEVNLEGANAVVVGRSNIVGRPLLRLLELANCTVTVCHSRTRDLANVVRRADIVVVAIGRAEFVKGDWIKEGAVVVDVGMNRLDDGTLVGDVEFAGAAERASFITPVPGGVGPMTIAMLMENTFRASMRAQG